MTRLSHQTFHMCSEDWGAAAAYQVAARHPSRVISLIYQEMLLPSMGLEEWATFNLRSRRLISGMLHFTMSETYRSSWLQVEKGNDLLDK